MEKKEAILTLQEQVTRLIADHTRLDKICTELNDENQKLKADNYNLRGSIKELSNEVARLEMAEALSGNSENKTKAKARINQLIKEVDKCIAHLTQAQ